jgi:hypothetical protein
MAFVIPETFRPSSPPFFSYFSFGWTGRDDCTDSGGILDFVVDSKYQMDTHGLADDLNKGTGKMNELGWRLRMTGSYECFRRGKQPLNKEQRTTSARTFQQHQVNLYNQEHKNMRLIFIPSSNPPSISYHPSTNLPTVHERYHHTKWKPLHSP